MIINILIAVLIIITVSVSFSLSLLPSSPSILVQHVDFLQLRQPACLSPRYSPRNRFTIAHRSHTDQRRLAHFQNTHWTSEGERNAPAAGRRSHRMADALFCICAGGTGGHGGSAALAPLAALAAGFSLHSTGLHA